MSPGRLKLSDRVGVILAGATLLFSVSGAATIVIPSLDPAMGETTDAARTLDEQSEHGMRLYRSEGCWYCHTQQVRRTATDTALGDALAPGDYAGQIPAMLGAERLGPDLTHVGDRYASRSDELRALLSDPRRDRGPSTMPSYGYLSDGDLDALVEYLLSLS